MTQPQGVSCWVCNKQRSPSEINSRESKLLKKKNILICTRCEAGKKEPRAFIIIVARTKGFDAVADYIKQHRYEGNPITGKELIV